MCSPMSAVAKDVGSDSSSSALLAGAAATDKTSINAECPDHIWLMGPGPMSMAGLDRAQSGSSESGDPLHVRTEYAHILCSSYLGLELCRTGRFLCLGASSSEPTLRAM